MKIVKTIILVLVVVFSIPLIVALFVESEYAVEKEVTIEKSKDEVFSFLKQLKNQDQFSSWANMDPDMEKIFTGTDGEVGFISAWNSTHEKVGRGEQEIVSITEGERLDYELRFYEPFVATDNAHIVTEAINDSVTLVKWGFSGEMGYPKNVLLLMMDMEEMLGGQLQEGLLNLKDILE